MRAFDAEVVDAVWHAVEPLPPRPPSESHPLGCHRPRVPDRVCFEAILVRLVTGCAWVDAERLTGGAVSDTTLRARRDDWIEAGVFDRLATEALAASDRIVGLDLSDCAVDGSQHKAPCGGEGTGPNPVDRGKRGWKWSLLTDRDGIPVGWATDGANRHDTVLLEPTLAAAAGRGLLADCESLHLDRGYDNSVVRRLVADAGIDLICAQAPSDRHGHRQAFRATGMRWPHRADQLVALELRPARSQHRPPPASPPGATRARHRADHHRQAGRLAESVEPVIAPICATS